MKKHIELNNNSSSFTGNATYYAGKAYWSKKDKNKDIFLSISDCYNTVRLHPNLKHLDNKELKAYKKKLIKLSSFIYEFANKIPDNVKDIK